MSVTDSKYWCTLAWRTAPALASLLSLSPLAACNDSDGDPADSVGQSGTDDPTETDPSAEDPLDDPSLTPPGGDPSGTVQKCDDKEVSLTAVTLGDPRPFDLVIVADHSDSLGWSRDQLAAGLSDLLESIKGREVRIFVLTPTQFGQSSAPARNPVTGGDIVHWRDPDTGDAYEHAVTRYVQSCHAADGQMIDCPEPGGWEPYSVEGHWEFEMPPAIATLTADLDDQAFAAQQEAVKNAILAIGGTGSPVEQPLCSLNRYILQAAEALPDNAVFLLISDEDDISHPDECAVQFHGKLQINERVVGIPCDGACDSTEYKMTSDRATKVLDLVCAAFDDMGMEIPDTRKPLMMHVSETSCDGVMPGACTEDELELAGSACDNGTKLVDCQRQCRDSEWECKVIVGAPPVNACIEGFVIDGESFDNVEDYCNKWVASDWRDCVSAGVDIEVQKNRSGSSRTTPLVRGDHPSNLAGAFHERARTVFGEGEYLVEAIVFAPDFSCKLGAGQSHATNLIDFVGDRDFVFPLCEPYDSALAGIWDFADTLIETEFPLTLLERQWISRVIVIDQNGVERQLRAGDYHHDRARSLLTIQASALHATDDKLRIELVRECPPA